KRAASCVSKFPAHHQALLSERLCPIIVGLHVGQVRGCDEPLRPHRRSHSFASSKCPLQKVPPLTPMAMHNPEPPQCSTQPQGHFSALHVFSWHKPPLERCSQVVMLPL